MRVLRACFGASGLVGLALAFEPPLAAVALPALLAVAGSLGVASGAVLATIGATVPAGRAGVIAGTIGAAGGLAGLLPPTLLAAVHVVNGSYAIGMTLLAGAALAGAAYLHIHRRWMSAALVFPATVGAQRAATIVVALPAAGRGNHATHLIAPVITLASRQEMVVVSVVPDRAHSDEDGYPLITGLRLHLPRHRFVAVVVGSGPRPEEIALIDDLLADGTVPVVLTTRTDPGPVAANLAGALHADYVLLHPPKATGAAPLEPANP